MSASQLSWSSRLQPHRRINRSANSKGVADQSRSTARSLGSRADQPKRSSMCCRRAESPLRRHPRLWPRSPGVRQSDPRRRLRPLSVGSGHVLGAKGCSDPAVAALVPHAARSAERGGLTTGRGCPGDLPVPVAKPAAAETVGVGDQLHSVGHGLCPFCRRVRHPVVRHRERREYATQIEGPSTWTPGRRSARRALDSNGFVSRATDTEGPGADHDGDRQQKGPGQPA